MSKQFKIMSRPEPHRSHRVVEETVPPRTHSSQVYPEVFWVAPRAWQLGRRMVERQVPRPRQRTPAEELDQLGVWNPDFFEEKAELVSFKSDQWSLLMYTYLNHMQIPRHRLL